MQPVRFIHAADLHLDTAFPGLVRQVSSELSRRLREATFTALERLVSLCEDEQPDFLILAGDIYNQEDLSLKAQLAVRNACERLGRKGIRVFLAHGNHDPLSSRLKTLEWPDNVTVFGSAGESFPVYRQGNGEEIIAVVHGISHSGPRETRNLASWFQRGPQHCPQIGVLHTSMGTADGQAIYAPASVDDLVASGLDYWALGHVHEYTIVCREPLALYPGAIQGLHVNETGPHGCVLVTLTPDAPQDESAADGLRPGVKPTRQFRALAPVGWHLLELDLDRVEPPAKAEGEDPPDSAAPSDGIDSMTRLERFLRGKLADLGSAAWPGCETMVVRLKLKGRTPLDGELRRRNVQDELIEALQEGAEDAEVAVWIKDILVETRPLFDREASLAREDLLGEVLRRADLLRGDEDKLSALADDALGDLYVKGKSRKLPGRPEGDELLRLLDEAERLCADYLENH